MDLRTMATERENPNTKNFSAMNIREAIEVMHKEDMRAVTCIEDQLDQIEQVITITSDALEQGGRIIYMGAGTSGRIGILDAAECPPTFGVDANTVIGLIAGGERAAEKAIERAEDSKDLGKSDLMHVGLCERDVVVGIAASGRTPYVIGGLEYAKQIGAKTCAIVCNKQSEIKKICPFTIEAEPGPEVLTGSTRLKAGTTTKLICNMISTISMIRIGKIYKNYMVDVKMSNEKLTTRGIHIVCSVTGCDPAHAEAALHETAGEVKTAIVMLLLNCDKEAAYKALENAHGRIQNFMDQEI